MTIWLGVNDRSGVSDRSGVKVPFDVAIAWMLRSVDGQNKSYFLVVCHSIYSPDDFIL